MKKKLCATCCLLMALLAPSVRAANGACDAVRKHAQSLAVMLEAKVPAADRKLAAAATTASDYMRFGAGAMLQGQYVTAAWATVKAANLQWTPTNVANAAVALLYDGRLAESSDFLGCAASMAPQSPTIIEAQAMLAFRRRDCPTATRLIEEAARLMPDDMNVHYSAGVVEYRCGNRPLAAQQLDQAQDIAPSDRTVDRARHIVEGPAADKRKPLTNPPLKLIDECRRFMRRSLERGAIVARSNGEFEAVRGGKSPSEDRFNELRRYVEQQDRLLETMTEATQHEATQLGMWNGALDMSIHAYFGTMRRYAALWSNPTTSIELILASTLAMSPVALAQSHTPAVNGDYLVQDNIRNFLAASQEAVAERRRCDEACPLKPSKALKACRQQCAGEFCEKVLPAWSEAQQQVATNMETAKAGFEPAAREWIGQRLGMTMQAQDYMLRALKEFRAPATSGGGVHDINYWGQREEADFDREIRKGVLEPAYKQVRLADQALRRDWHKATVIVEQGRIGTGSTPVTCGRTFKALTFEDILDKLAAATEVDAKLKVDCLADLGPVKVGFSAESLDEVTAKVEGPWGKANASMSSDRFKVSYESEDGASASASVDPDGHITVTSGVKIGPVSSSGACDASGCRTGISASKTIYETKQDVTIEVVHVKVGTKLWTEIDSNGNANALAQATIGLGIGEKFGSTGVSCDFVEAKATFDFRAFCGAMAQ